MAVRQPRERRVSNGVKRELRTTALWDTTWGHTVGYPSVPYPTEAAVASGHDASRCMRHTSPPSPHERIQLSVVLDRWRGLSIEPIQHLLSSHKVQQCRAKAVKREEEYRDIPTNTERFAAEILRFWPARAGVFFSSVRL